MTHPDRVAIKAHRRARYQRSYERRRPEAAGVRLPRPALKPFSLNDPAFCASARRALLWAFGSDDLTRLQPKRWYQVLK